VCREEWLLPGFFVPARFSYKAVTTSLIRFLQQRLSAKLSSFFKQ
jgi:hypothetical protein